MKRVKELSQAFVEVNRSRFHAFLVPQEAFASLHKTLRKEHPKANHIAWACRFLDDGQRIAEDFSDDGEPKGCAGMPMLNVLRGNELVGCGVLVVRYFGGIKLGTGGMARAYAEAAKAAVSSAALSAYEAPGRVAFFTPFSQIGRWEHTIAHLGEFAIERRFGPEGAHWVVEGGQSAVGRLAEALTKARIDIETE
ncbi:MAG: YigZ family protein, partial [Epsilonproteobacteria bacterium]|nr:YigZ family protein [Campylobacterota bacterium]